MAFSTKAVEFGGTNEFVTMGDVLGFEYTSTRSFSLWFSTVSQGYGWLLSKHGDTPAYQGFGIYQLNTGELLVVLRSDNATSNFLQVTTTAKFNDGKRHHLLVAWDGNATPGAGGVSIWVDAVAQAVTVNQDTLTATILNSHPFNLGARTNISGFWIGMMDEVAVYSTELGSADATWLYNGGEPRDLAGIGAPAGLVSWWRMGEGDTHPTLLDSAGSNNGTMTNMESTDIRFLTGYDQVEATPAVTFQDEDGHAQFFAGVEPSPPAVVYYRMRGIDITCPTIQQPAYVYWTVMMAPDWDASELSPGDLPCGTDPSTDVDDIQIAVSWIEE